jgi:hypothetical protein
MAVSGSGNLKFRGVAVNPENEILPGAHAPILGVPLFLSPGVVEPLRSFI